MKKEESFQGTKITILKNTVIGYTERDIKGCKISRKLYKEFCDRYVNVVITDNFNNAQPIGVATNFKIVKNKFIANIELSGDIKTKGKIFRLGIRLPKRNRRKYLKNKKDYNIDCGILESIAMVEKANDVWK